MSKELSLRDADQQAIQLLLDLEGAGAIDAVSMTLDDPNMPYERWESLGRFLGGLGRRVNWYIGDWLNFGEAVYGEEAAQGIEATTAERYNEAERVTGLDHGTLMNIRSLCGKVAKTRRRAELGFWIHAEVAPLEPDEQVVWLQRAIDNGWTKTELRDAIRAEKNPAAEPLIDGGNSGSGGRVSICERIETSARTVYHEAQATSDGSYLVPASAMSQLAAALGEES